MNLKPIQFLVLTALVVLVNAVAIPQPEPVKEVPVQRDDARDNHNGGVMITSMKHLKEVLAGRTFTLPKSLGKVNETIQIKLEAAKPMLQSGNSNSDFDTGPNHRCLFRGQNLWDDQSIGAYESYIGDGLLFYMRVRSDYLAISKIDYDKKYVRSVDIWSVGWGSGTSDSHLSYQTDGNLCYYHENSPNPGWCSNTYGRSDMYLVCLDANDGRLLMGSLYIPPVANLPPGWKPDPATWRTGWTN
ncbi:hypothetical protein HDU79_002841 [Rhizoclosmatium sp. JEL0117]|nr:hypothetical protein HDU79_002841 [Rhizoclosmatium sp. JEL0117]